jgi:hypothetical protein
VLLTATHPLGTVPLSSAPVVLQKCDVRRQKREQSRYKSVTCREARKLSTALTCAWGCVVSSRIIQVGVSRSLQVRLQGSIITVFVFCVVFRASCEGDLRCLANGPLSVNPQCIGCESPCIGYESPSSRDCGTPLL